MPDISMCDQKECPKSKYCYRFRAEPNYRQSYFKPPFTDNGCEYFWSLEAAPTVMKREAIQRGTDPV